MKKKWIRILGLLLVLLTQTACGQQYAGTYNGTATLSLYNATNVFPISLTINQSNNGVINGTLTGQTIGSGNLTGSSSGNTITVSSLTVTGIQGCVFSGNLTLNQSNQLQGTLNSIGTTTLATNGITTSYNTAIYPTTAIPGTCSGYLAIQANR